MNENLRAIMKAISEDDELMDRATTLMNELNAADEATRPEVVARIVAFANEEGFALTEDDLAFDAAEGELEDEELMAVAGGCGCGDTSVMIPTFL